MKDPTATPLQPSSPLVGGTPRCPTCGSTATVTAATTPSADSYWRCTACGDLCVTDRDDSEWLVSMAVTSSALLRALRELTAALDRRVPQAHRASEVSISRDSAALKARATKRIEELERAPGVEKS